MATFTARGNHAVRKVVSSTGVKYGLRSDGAMLRKMTRDSTWYICSKNVTPQIFDQFAAKHGMKEVK